MQVFRISQTRYAEDVSGEGARLFGGRWNLPLIPCLYTSGSRALALLEFSANVNIYEIRRALSMVTYEIGEKGIHELKIPALPGNWKDNLVPRETQELGSRLLMNPATSVISVPSVIVPEEFNYLVNPGSDSGIKIMDIRDYVYDVRVKLR